MRDFFYGDENVLTLIVVVIIQIYYRIKINKIIHTNEYRWKLNKVCSLVKSNVRVLTWVGTHTGFDTVHNPYKMSPPLGATGWKGHGTLSSPSDTSYELIIISKYKVLKK